MHLQKEKHGPLGRIETMTYDLTVIGGGLAGMLAAIEAERNGIKVTLVDSAIPAAQGMLGGFAKFSGAKFSRLPAGQGLVPIAGSEQSLEIITEEALELLGLVDLTQASSSNHDLGGSGLKLRSYESMLLTPSEIDELLHRCEAHLNHRVKVIKSRALSVQNESQFSVLLENGEVLESTFLLLAAGRQGEQFARKLGAVEQNGKGFDVGVRLEFQDVAALSKLRELGPDAKILDGKCRTFCLNAPGEIYRYPFLTFTIPGGVVADQGHPRGNVGILRRVDGKVEALPHIIERIKGLPPACTLNNPFIVGAGLGDKEGFILHAYGYEIAIELKAFMSSLATSGLIDLNKAHAIHFPLIDWHWPVFGLPESHRTTVENLYVAGDIAGHARGLLQAAVSGMLAGREIGSA